MSPDPSVSTSPSAAYGRQSRRRRPQSCTLQLVAGRETGIFVIHCHPAGGYASILSLGLPELEEFSLAVFHFRSTVGVDQIIAATT